MPADDHPIDALEHQFQMEDLSVSPVGKAIVTVLGKLPLIWPLDKIVESLKDHLAADSLERIRLLLDIYLKELRKQDERIKGLHERMDEIELKAREETLRELVLDAARKAESTRDKERVKRIALILANASVEPKSVDGDEVEEMMRIAMELSDRDISFLRDLIHLQGHLLQTSQHIPRFQAYMSWKNGPWENNVDSEIESVFSKLQSFGLVSRLAPPNNLNISADFQSQYVLLKKGTRFAALIQESAAVEPDK